MPHAEQGRFIQETLHAEKVASLFVAAAAILINSAPAAFFGMLGFFAGDTAEAKLKGAH